MAGCVSAIFGRVLLVNIATPFDSAGSHTHGANTISLRLRVESCDTVGTAGYCPEQLVSDVRCL